LNQLHRKCFGLVCNESNNTFLGEFLDPPGDNSGPDDDVGHPLPRPGQHLHQHHQQIAKCGR